VSEKEKELKRIFFWHVVVQDEAEQKDHDDVKAN
jgi:hypothetical protein